MHEKKASGLVVTALDEVAWLLNLRGSDISFNPVFFAFVIITADSVMFVCYSVAFLHNIYSLMMMISVLWESWLGGTTATY